MTKPSFKSSDVLTVNTGKRTVSMTRGEFERWKIVCVAYGQALEKWKKKAPKKPAKWLTGEELLAYNKTRKEWQKLKPKSPAYEIAKIRDLEND